MIRHVVAFRWNDTSTPDHRSDLGAALDALPNAIPAISVYRHGPDLGVNDGNHDYAIVADFTTVDDFLTYRDHPEHQRFIAEHIAGRVAERAAVQFEC
jgi:hypothetical protein